MHNNFPICGALKKENVNFKSHQIFLDADDV